MKKNKVLSLLCAIAIVVPVMSFNAFASENEAIVDDTIKQYTDIGGAAAGQFQKVTPDNSEQSIDSDFDQNNLETIINSNPRITSTLPESGDQGYPADSPTYIFFDQPVKLGPNYYNSEVYEGSTRISFKLGVFHYTNSSNEEIYYLAIIPLANKFLCNKDYRIYLAANTVVNDSNLGNYQYNYSFKTLPIIDTRAPVISFKEPTKTVYTTGNVYTIKGVVSDNDPVNASYVLLKVDNGTTQKYYYDYIFNSEFTWENIPLLPGKNTLTLSAEDRSGNLSAYNASTQTRIITAEEVPPQINIGDLTAQDQDPETPGIQVFAPKVNLTGTVSDDVSPAANILFKIGGKAVRLSQTGAFNFSAALVSGSNTILAEAKDQCGNTATKEIKIDYIEKIAPVVTISGPKADMTTNLQKYPISVSVSEPSTVKLYLTNSAGTDQLIAEQYIVSKTFRFENVDLQQGSNILHVTAVDNCGNTAVENAKLDTRTINFDGEKPIITLDDLSLADERNDLEGIQTSINKITVKGRVSDDQTLAQSIVLKLNNATVKPAIDGSFNVQLTLRPGANQISVSATDRAGNTEVNNNYMITLLEKIPPKITINSPARDIVSNKEGDYSLIGSISEISKISVYLSKDGAAAEKAAEGYGNKFNFSLSLTEGVNVITVNAVDTSGNASANGLQRKIVIDKTKPTISDLKFSGVQGAVENEFYTSKVLVTGTVSDNFSASLSDFRVTVAGKPAKLIKQGSTISFSCTATLAADVNNIIAICCLDAANNKEELRFNIKQTVMGAMIPKAAEYDKYIGGTLEIPIKILISGTKLLSISDDDRQLTLGKDYTIVGNKALLSEEYLQPKQRRTLNLTFQFSKGHDAIIKVTLFNSLEDLIGTANELMYTVSVALNKYVEIGGSMNDAVCVKTLDAKEKLQQAINEQSGYQIISDLKAELINCLTEVEAAIQEKLAYKQSHCLMIMNVTESTSTIAPNATLTGLLCDGTVKTFRVDSTVGDIVVLGKTIYKDGYWLANDGLAYASINDIAAIGKIIYFESGNDFNIISAGLTATEKTPYETVGYKYMYLDNGMCEVLYQKEAGQNSYCVFKFMTEDTVVFQYDKKGTENDYSDDIFTVRKVSDLSSFEDTTLSYIELDLNDEDVVSLFCVDGPFGELVPRDPPPLPEPTTNTNLLAMRTGKSVVKVASDGKTAQLGLELFAKGEIKTYYSVPVNIDQTLTVSQIKQILVKQIFGESTEVIPSSASNYFGYAAINDSGLLTAYYEGSTRNLNIESQPADETGTFGAVSIHRGAVAYISGKTLAVAQVGTDNKAIMNEQTFAKTNVFSVSDYVKITLIDAQPNYPDNDGSIAAYSSTLAELSKSAENASGDTYVIDFSVREKPDNEGVFEVYQIIAYKQAVLRS